jgi:DNA-binding NtrC family response regulator
MKDAWEAFATQSADGTGPAEQGHELVIVQQKSVVRHALASRPNVRIGRAEDSDILLRDPAASRRHAVIHLGNEPRVEDLNSRNGTLLRGERLAPRRPEALRPGDPVQIGTTLLFLQRASAGGGPLGVQVAAPQSQATPLVSMDPVMRAVQAMVERVAPSSLTVLISGETGVGKELVAETIHALGPRSSKPLVRINCAALTDALLESELFGHERGAFTGAVRDKPGLFEAAQGGTAFLDEIGELPLAAQAKLLRVLETREVVRVGGLKPLRLDVRFIAATNRDLRAEVARGAFREDLYYRLSGASIAVPPLRERTADIEPLIRHFARVFCEQMDRPPPSIGAAALDRMLRHPWPGNIRQLRNAIEWAVLRASGRPLEEGDLPPELSKSASEPLGSSLTPPPPPLEPELGLDLTAAGWAERQRIVAALAECHGNQTRAAEKLGIPRRTFVAKLTTYRIPRPRTRGQAESE